MKNYIVGVIAVIALGLGIFSVVKAPEQVVVKGESVRGPQGIQGIQGPAGKDGRNGIDGKDGKDASGKFGSVVGPFSYFPIVANNDLQKSGATVKFNVGTTTPFAVKNPFGATSTLMIGSATFITSSTTASVVTLAKAASAYATTTPLTIQAISAGAQATIMSSSTPLLATGAINSLVFGPNDYFVIGMADGTPEAGTGTFSPVGSVSYEFVRN